MKNKWFFEGLALFFLVWGIWIKIWQLSAQWLLRWKFISLLTLSSLIILIICISVMVHKEIPRGFKNSNQKFGLSIFVLLIPFIASLLPPRQSPYVLPGQTTHILSSPLAMIEASENFQQVIEVPLGTRSLLDWVKVFSSNPVENYENEAVDISGTVSHEGSLTDGQFYLNRLTLTCCVANPVAVGLTVNWPETKVLPEGSWVRVKGRIRIHGSGSEKYPQIQAEEVELIAQPEQPYLFNK
ncbi:MAG: TIGR03943 family protein [Anaerolineae bacterium]|nr:TIGR03943 family protein [Anaerolineae bacterium]